MNNNVPTFGLDCSASSRDYTDILTAYWDENEWRFRRLPPKECDPEEFVRIYLNIIATSLGMPPETLK